MMVEVVYFALNTANNILCGIISQYGEQMKDEHREKIHEITKSLYELSYQVRK